MIIAHQKRKSNIAEYILYMWQVEDAIRSLKFDIDRIETNLIAHFDAPPSERKQIRDWYLGLVETMQSEGITQRGHLQVNINTLSDLLYMHSQLLGDPEHQDYQRKFVQTLPVIEEFRAKSPNVHSEVEACLVALYTLWMLKAQGKTISQATSQAIAQMGELIAMLSQLFHQYEKGELQI
jgi:hypothetical protein